MNGSGEYAELLGKESDTNAQIRTQGFHAVLDRYSNLKRVSHSRDWSQAEAFQKTETCFRRMETSQASLQETTPWLWARRQR